MIRLWLPISRAPTSAVLKRQVSAPTVKHFPGLGRVRSDTHHFSADLDTPLHELEASDWIPFRKVLADPKAQLMIGHVTLTSVDPDRPASHSKTRRRRNHPQEMELSGRRHDGRSRDGRDLSAQRLYGGDGGAQCRRRSVAGRLSMGRNSIGYSAAPWRQQRREASMPRCLVDSEVRLKRAFAPWIEPPRACPHVDHAANRLLSD